MHVKEVDTQAFSQEVLQRSNEVPVVVDFWAAWCGPCRVLGPILERLADEYAGAFELAKIDVDQNQALASQFGVQGIPFVLAFRDGRPVSQFTGSIPEPAVRRWLDELLPSTLERLVDEARDALIEGDQTRAEELFRRVLAEKADNQAAGTGLAALLLADGRTADALDVLRPLGPTPEAEKLRAAARLAGSQSGDVTELKAKLAANQADDETRLRLATALAAGFEYEPALDHLIGLVQYRSPLAEEAKRAVVDIFEVLGPGHPLTAAYRRRLANALF